MSSEATTAATQFRLQEWAAQIRDCQSRPDGMSVVQDRLAAVIEAHTGQVPCIPDTLYLCCGRRPDRFKGLVWEGGGWLLLYKRLADGRFQWPRSVAEVQSLTPQQFCWLMEGLTHN